MLLAFTVPDDVGIGIDVIQLDDDDWPKAEVIVALSDEPADVSYTWVSKIGGWFRISSVEDVDVLRVLSFWLVDMIFVCCEVISEVSVVSISIEAADKLCELIIDTYWVSKIGTWFTFSSVEVYGLAKVWPFVEMFIGDGLDFWLFIMDEFCWEILFDVSFSAVTVSFSAEDGFSLTLEWWIIKSSKLSEDSSCND